MIGQKSAGLSHFHVKRGKKPLLSAKKKKRTQELALVKSHPFVQNMLEYFPDAEIKDIRKIENTSGNLIDSDDEQEQD